MSRKFRKFLAIIGICLFVYICFFIPKISFANLEEMTKQTDDKMVEAVSSPSSKNLADSTIKQHEGYSYYVDQGKYTNTEKNGIPTNSINSIVKRLNDYWISELKNNTSIFCREYGQPFPGRSNAYLDLFHKDSAWVNTNKMGDVVYDIVEYYSGRGCGTTLSIIETEVDEDGDPIESAYKTIHESDIDWENNTYTQQTRVRVNYDVPALRNLTKKEAYALSYSEQKNYKNDRAQVALWMITNGKLVSNSYSGETAVSNGKNLEYASEAVADLSSNPVKPTIKRVANKEIGTVIDGSNYKIGPIQMSDYTYGYSTYAKDYSGSLICGIVGAKIKLDNGSEFELTKDNFVFTPSSAKNRKKETEIIGSTIEIWKAPTQAEGYIYPTPNTEFYIVIPISKCIGATKVENVTMTYKYTTASGNGWDLSGTFDKLTWEASLGNTHTDCTYDCDVCAHDDLTYSERSATENGVNKRSHSYWCGTTGYCNSCKGKCKGHKGERICNEHHAHDEWQSKDNPGCYKTETVYSKGTMKCDGHHSHNKWKSKDNPGCYNSQLVLEKGSLKCGKTAHKHGDGKCNSKDCSHSHTLLCLGGLTCSHSHTKACCSKTVHEHVEWGAVIINTCYNTNSYYKQGTLNCSYGGTHTKTAWSSKDSPGCYNTNTSYKKGAVNCNKLHADTPWSSAANPGCFGTRYNTDYCKHGHFLGRHTAQNCTWGETHDHVCYGGDAGTKCPHNHTTCWNLKWTVVKVEENVHAQNLLAVNNAKVIEKKSECYISNIPLVAKVEINKYIYDVQHSVSYSGHDSTMSASGERNNLTEDEKKNNPVYVEYGDLVTYKIVLKNYSKFAVKVKVEDVIPENNAASLYNIKIGKETLTQISELKTKTVTVNAEKEASFTVTIKVNKNNGTYINTANIISRNSGKEDYLKTLEGPVVNHAQVTCDGTTNEPKITSKDWYVLNNYNISINKYVSDYTSSVTTTNNNNGFTNEENNITDRSGMTEEDKKAKPVQVEKGETIEYTIKVSNDSTVTANSLKSGEKKATSIYPPTITETLQKGLKYNTIAADIYKADGTKKYESNTFVKPVSIDSERNTVTISTLGELNGTKIMLDPGEYLVLKVGVIVEESNMFLHSLENTVIMSEISNVNNKVVVNDEYDENISNKKVSSDYVKMKDLVISGKVWLDSNKDGLMNSEKAMEGIVVRLYSVGTGENGANTLVRTTKTDANGLYTFAKQEDGNWYNGTYSYENGVTESEQRIPKATGKDENKNYTEDSKLIEYYIEYEYDGLTYKSTEVYSGKNNLNDNGSIKNDNYYIDSNAREFKETRDTFDAKHEIVAFDKAYDGQLENEVNLEYAKNGHTSTLKTNNQRVMTARSFVSEPNDINSTEYLWLYKQGSDYKLPETEYLKYINLGLEEREDVDISITQDVYEVKTTVNGEEMTYEYNQNNYTLGNEAIDKEQEIGNDEDYYQGDLDCDGHHEHTEECYNVTNTAYKGTLICKLKEHTHTNQEGSCYGVVCGKEEHTHTDRGGECWTTRCGKNDTHRWWCRIWRKGKCTCEAHTHKNSCYIFTCKLTTHVHSNSCKGLVCNEEEHTHLPWVSKSNSGCYSTKYKENKTLNCPYGGTHEYVEWKSKDEPGCYTTKINIGSGNESALSLQYNSEFYMTGYESNSSPISLYEFKIFNSDYNYKVSQYSSDTVKEYKGTESELNVEATYRIKVTNNSITNDEPYLDGENKDIKVYTGINEVVEYYDTEFVDLELNEDGTVKTFNIKTKDENGYLVNTPLKVVKAEYVMKDGTRKEAILSATSLYNEARILKDNEGNLLYNTLYIRPNDIKDVILAEGESVDILITFAIDKENIDNELNLILGDKINVAEMSAYSTYYKKADGTYYAAGLVDKDSNPGNFGEMYTLSADKNVNSQEYLALYEDDTFKSGINVLLQTIDNERILTGFVWDDARSDEAKDEDGVQYIGDGKYDTSVNALEEAKKNQSVSNQEANDIAIKDMKTQLVEMIAMPDRDASGNVIGERVYEETIEVNGEESQMTARTNGEGKYELKGYIPGTYVVKFFYGDDSSLENMLIFNGQDYKSTTYQATEAEYAENKSNPDEVLAILEKANISDAKDDEITRLESISYSETMTNNLNNILRGKDSSDKEALVANTNMESETAEFLVKTEKELSSKTKLTYAETMQKFMNTTRHPIQNIDFGIEYRPELQVSLSKYISNVKITTSDANGQNTTQALVDAKFQEYYGIVVRTDIASGSTEFLTDAEGEIIRVGRNATNEEIESAVNAAGADISRCQKTDDGLYIVTLAGTELDTEKSVGLSNLQYVENVYDRDINGNLFLYDSNGYVKATQGFVYLNIDDNIMQGASISIEYVFAGNNISEIDRISSNLSSLRFKENEAAKAYRGDEGKYYDQVALQLGENTGYIDLDYSAAGTARNKLFSEYYRYELTEEGTIKKDANGNDVVYRIKDKKVSDTDYYGRYLGSVYYTGVIGENDIVAELKIDKILDYIDNDLVFDNSQNNGLNSLWKTTTSKELYEGNLISKDAFKELTGSDNLVGKYLVDSSNRAYDTAERSNLAILLDDRVRDYAEGEEDTTVNKDISKYLVPRYSNGANSFGTVKLVASKVISPEETTEDMNYENIGEIVQYSSVTGRVTTLGTTLGNANIRATSEWDEARKESDTAATEQITLTPPTGLGKVEQIVRNTVEGASYTVIVIIAVSIVCVSVLVGIRLYRKRRIK